MGRKTTKDAEAPRKQKGGQSLSPACALLPKTQPAKASFLQEAAGKISAPPSSLTGLPTGPAEQEIKKSLSGVADQQPIA